MSCLLLCVILTRSDYDTHDDCFKVMFMKSLQGSEHSMTIVLMRCNHEGWMFKDALDCFNPHCVWTSIFTSTKFMEWLTKSFCDSTLRCCTHYYQAYSSDNLLILIVQCGEWTITSSHRHDVYDLRFCQKHSCIYRCWGRCLVYISTKVHVCMSNTVRA